MSLVAHVHQVLYFLHCGCRFAHTVRACEGVMHIKLSKMHIFKIVISINIIILIF